MPRLFVAIELPESVVTTLAETQCGVPGARWVTPDRMHCTLRFIGEVEATAASVVEDVLGFARARPFEVTVRGLGWFPERAPPRVLWAGIDPRDPLTALRRTVQSALNRAGIAREKQRFIPHVTLARLARAPLERVREWVLQHDAVTTEPFEVDRFVLFSSQLTPNGPIYRREAIYPFR